MGSDGRTPDVLLGPLTSGWEGAGTRVRAHTLTHRRIFVEVVVEEPFRHSHGSYGKRHLAQHMRGPVVSESGLSET